MNETKRISEAEKWTMLIQEFRSSGKSHRVWSGENGVKRSTLHEQCRRARCQAVCNWAEELAFLLFARRSAGERNHLQHNRNGEGVWTESAELS